LQFFLVEQAPACVQAVQLVRAQARFLVLSFINGLGEKSFKCGWLITTAFQQTHNTTGASGLAPVTMLEIYTGN
jgi:hypothetical protein